MASVESKIWDALRSRLQVMYGDLDLPFAWPNRDFPGSDANGNEKPKPPKYLKIAFIPNVAERRFIGSNDPHRFIGLLQISVCWPLNTFLEPALEMAGKVAGYFPCDSRHTAEDVVVRIQKHPDVGPMLVEDTGIMIPISISWESWS